MRIAGFDAETDRELTKKELEQLLKEDQNPTTQKIAGTILALSEPQYISTEECVHAFRIMADEETQEMCEKPQTLSLIHISLPKHPDRHQTQRL